MAIFAIKTGAGLTTTPQTSFATLQLAINYALNYANTNQSFPTIIGTSLTNFTWKYTSS